MRKGTPFRLFRQREKRNISRHGPLPGRKVIHFNREFSGCDSGKKSGVLEE
jgi:hypothetical protein